MSNRLPNFVFILSDNQGYWSLGAYGNKEIHTPNLDRLATEGVCFDSFYCASPVCSPARASILTGTIPSTHGVLDWLGGGGVDKKEYETLMLPKELVLANLADDVKPEELDSEADKLPFSLTRNFRRYMKNENAPIQYLQLPTYSQILSEKGYRCGIAGKWHLGAGNLPQAGFDFWSVVPRGGTPYKMPDWISDGQIHIGTQYVTDLITDEAIRFLNQQEDDCPFYLSVHYTAPHDPWREIDQPQEIWKLYNDCPFSSLPRTTVHKNQVMKRPIPKTDAEFREMAQAYYTCITAMDQNIGRLIDHLKEIGQLDNTIIVFTADNGMNFGHHGIWGKGNGTYPMNLYETSAKIPYIMWNPKFMRSGVRISEPLSHYDIFPTLLDYAQAKPDEMDRPGKSFRALLQGETVPAEERNIVVCDEYGPVRMIRNGDWKLIWCYLDQTGELYNLREDPDEERNLAQLPEYQSRVEQMKQDMDAWFARYVCPEYDALQYPVNGEGQMNVASQWYCGEKVFVTTTGEEIKSTHDRLMR